MTNRILIGLTLAAAMLGIFSNIQPSEKESETASEIILKFSAQAEMLAWQASVAKIYAAQSAEQVSDQTKSAAVKLAAVRPTTAPHDTAMHDTAMHDTAAQNTTASAAEPWQILVAESTARSDRWRDLVEQIHQHQSQRRGLGLMNATHWMLTMGMIAVPWCFRFRITRSD